MLKNSDSDSDIEARHMRSGRSFRKIPLVDLFKKSYRPLAQDEGFYSGEEAEKSYEEYSEFVREEEVETKEARREELGTSGTVPIIEVSVDTPPIVLETSSNQSNQSSQINQSTQSIVTRILVQTQLRNQGKSMEDEMRLPIFIGDGSEDPDQHWFLCEAVWSIKKVTHEVVKRSQFSTTLRDHVLSWYMKFVTTSRQPRALNEINTALSAEFKKPNLDSQCITKLKEIKRKVTEPIWKFN
jgi:hypothetical protein